MSLDIAPAERLALIGENGAGKSTLMNVLYGLYRPDSGELTVDGKAVRLKNPRDALALGIGMVHQHFMLVPSLTVTENVVLGREPTRLGMLEVDVACRQVEATAQRFGFALDPRALVSSLSVGSQQKVEIVKALHRGARTLILDEPTAVLTPQERDELFRVTRSLSEEGHTVIFIGHKLTEVLGFADRIAVMRRGRLVSVVPAKEASAESLAALMVGAGGGRSEPPAASAQVLASPEPGAPVLELQGLRARGAHGLWALDDVSLDLKAGELVGIAGVDGNGQTELAEVLTGLRPWDSGVVKLRGRALLDATPALMRAQGVAHVPEDRLARAMVGAMTVEENLSLGRHRRAPFARGPWIERAARHQSAQASLEDFDVRPPRAELPMAALSGGNQQKVVLARELALAPALLVAVQPTRGLDIAAVAAIHRRLLAARAAGAAVLLISLDLDEVLALSDRLYVLAGGRVTLSLPRAAFDERQVGRAMLGAAHG